MKLYPLVFSFRDVVIGNGFVATVAIDGRILLAEEDDNDIWLFGVQPGGIAAGDPVKPTAFTEFKKSYLSVLFDIAAESTSFDEFNCKVTTLFNEVNEPNLADWERALADVRAGNLSVPDLKTVKSELRMPSLTIDNITPGKANSGINEFDDFSEAA